MFDTERSKESAGPENRLSTRSNIFASGELAFGGSSVSIRIRNLSATGALIEGSGLPSAATLVRLRKGTLSTDGRVAWQMDNRAGLQFARTITVADWLPGSASRQAEVDQAFQAIKRGDLGPRKVPLTSTIGPEELNSLARATEALGDLLSNDKSVLSRYMLELQTLDIVAQALRKIAIDR